MDAVVTTVREQARRACCSARSANQRPQTTVGHALSPRVHTRPELKRFVCAVSVARSRLRNPELLRLLRGREYDLVYQALLTVLAKIDVTTAMRQRFMEMIMGDEGMRSRMEANHQAGTAALRRGAREEEEQAQQAPEQGQEEASARRCAQMAQFRG